jgi:hypothetical protein
MWRLLFCLAGTFEEMISGKITSDNESYLNLQNRNFLREDDKDNFTIEKIAAKYRSKKRI